MCHSDCVYTSLPSGHRVMKVCVQRDQSLGRQVVWNSLSEGAGFRQSCQSGWENPGVSTRNCVCFQYCWGVLLWLPNHVIFCGCYVMNMMQSKLNRALWSGVHVGQRFSVAVEVCLCWNDTSIMSSSLPKLASYKSNNGNLDWIVDLRCALTWIVG